MLRGDQDHKAITLNTRGTSRFFVPIPRLMSGLVFTTLFSLLFILVSCSNSAQPTAQGPLILTDNPGVLLAAQAYNSVAGGAPVRVQLAETTEAGLVPLLRSMVNKPDALIGSNYLYPQSLSLFDSIAPLLELKGQTTGDFPPGFLVREPESQQIISVPLAVDLPVVVFRKNDSTMARSQQISLSELKLRSSEYTRVENRRLTRAGFLPLSNPAFGFLTAMIMGANFEGSVDAIRVKWNETALEDARKFLASWFDSDEITQEIQNQYQEQMAYDPWYSMISDGRIRFTVVPFQEYYSLPGSIRKQLQFAWITGPQGIPLWSQPTSASLVRNSSKKDQTIEFLSWISSSEGILSIYDLWIDQRLPGLSYLGGFPITPLGQSSWSFEYFKGLNNRIPGVDALQPVQLPPSQWKKLKQEVLLPWIIEVSELEKDETANQSTLKEQFNRWQLLYRQE